MFLFLFFCIFNFWPPECCTMKICIDIIKMYEAISRKMKKQIKNGMVFKNVERFIVTGHDSIEFFHWIYKMYRINVVEILMSFKLTNHECSITKSNKFVNV